jgi:amino acid permease
VTSASADHVNGAAPNGLTAAGRLQRLVLVLICGGITLAVPSVGLLVSLFGAVGVTVLAAAAPSWCDSQSYRAVTQSSVWRPGS